MKISDIKDKGLRELAELRRKEDFNYDYSDTLHFAFEWDETPECYDYWDDVNEGRITTLDKEPTVESSEGLIVMKDLRIQYLENENIELKERLERWDAEMKDQLNYATYERKEKRKLIDQLVSLQRVQERKETPVNVDSNVKIFKTHKDHVVGEIISTEEVNGELKVKYKPNK
mgnify:CR=1 FL=1|tara:strand:- start:17124 stop:17642 length:519 start_codon:yes stop_codon:yes gene_type:complete